MSSNTQSTTPPTLCTRSRFHLRIRHRGAIICVPIILLLYPEDSNLLSSRYTSVLKDITTMIQTHAKLILPLTADGSVATRLEASSNQIVPSTSTTNKSNNGLLTLATPTIQCTFQIQPMDIMYQLLSMKPDQRYQSSLSDHSTPISIPQTYQSEYVPSWSLHVHVSDTQRAQQRTIQNASNGTTRRIDQFVTQKK